MIIPGLNRVRRPTTLGGAVTHLEGSIRSGRPATTALSSASENNADNPASAATSTAGCQSGRSTRWRYPPEAGA
jgi:hypothetical protein